MKKSHVVLATIFSLSLVLLHPKALAGDASQLRVKYYSDKCPHVEFIVARFVHRAYIRDPGLAAGLIRLFFHDCFVKGCDASILLDSTPSGEPVEKAAPGNSKGLKGLDVIDEIKAHLEQFCPQTVSCSDILAFATREAVFLAGLPYYPVRAGRRDSHTSRSADVDLPFPMMSVEDLTQLFASRGLTEEDLVVLSGAHSIGHIHCKMFNYRLNSSSNDDKEHPIEAGYATYLRSKCRSPEAAVKFDPISPYRLDNTYYTHLIKGRGLLQSDHALAFDSRTSGIVRQFASNPNEWTWKFVNAMIRLGNLNVLTGNEGQIRHNCRAFD